MSEYLFRNCTRCSLRKTRVKVVPGRGDASIASLLFIGEAPGISEDMLGKAFIGEAGRFLDTMLNQAGIPGYTCFFTNTILCRPCDKRSGPNREPTKEEIFACLPCVMEIIATIAIAGVVFVGAIANKYYWNRFSGCHKLHITHPSALLQIGGKSSSLYRDNVNKLQNFYNEIKE